MNECWDERAMFKPIELAINSWLLLETSCQKFSTFFVKVIICSLMEPMCNFWLSDEDEGKCLTMSSRE
jgi:hypothetical protein